MSAPDLRFTPLPSPTTTDRHDRNVPVQATSSPTLRKINSIGRQVSPLRTEPSNNSSLEKIFGSLSLYQSSSIAISGKANYITQTNREPIKEKFDYMEAKTIRFSQNNVARYFSDGQSLDDAVLELTTGKITPEDFPAIRVARFNGQWTTLDNRRLACLYRCFRRDYSRDQGGLEGLGNR